MMLIYKLFVMFYMWSLLSFSGSIQTGVTSDSTKGNEYFRPIRLEFSNEVKIHVIITFSDQQFVDISEGIHAPQVHARRYQLYL